MFETVTTKLVKLVGSDLYIPPSSLASAENVAVLSLVERKASKWWHGSNSYFPTSFTLQNVVLGDGLKVDIEPERDFTGYNRTSELKVDGSLSGHMKSAFSAELSNVDSITAKANLGDLHLTEVSEQSLLDQLKGRKLNMEHELVRELVAKKRRALCVVVAVVKTTAPATISATLNVKVDADEKVNTPVVDAGGEEGKVDVDDDKTKAMNLPAGTVVAYQVVELAVNKDGAMRVMVSHDAKGGFSMDLGDQVDAVPCKPAAATVEHDLEGFKLMDVENRRTLVPKLLQLCASPQHLLELATALNLPESSGEAAEVKEVLDCMSGHRQDAATTSVQTLCRALRNLDVEALYGLSKVTAEDLALLTAVVDKTYSGAALPYSDPNTQQLISQAGYSLVFLILGLDYVLDGQMVKPPSHNQCLLNSAYIALTALCTCYDCAKA